MSKKRRLSQKYGRHIEKIAELYVLCSENGAATVEKVHQELPHLSGVRDNTFTRWQGHPQWEAALQSARDAAKLEDELDPSLRGLKFLRWSRDTLALLLEEHETAKQEHSEKLRVSLEGRIVKLTEAIRAEERHQDDVRDRLARRDMRTFARNLMEVLGTFLDEHGKRRLLELQREPAQLMRGIE